MISEQIKAAILKQDFHDPEHAEKRNQLVDKEKSNLLAKSFGNVSRGAKVAKGKTEDVKMSNRDKLFFAEDLEEIVEHCGCGRPKKGKKVEEQGGFVPRGGAFQKMAARTGGPGGAGPVPGSPADRAAKMSAFERQKAQWAAQAKAKAAALPPGMKKRVGEGEEKVTAQEQELPAQVLKQRRPFRPGEEKSRLMQGQYPRVGFASANRSALT